MSATLSTAGVQQASAQRPAAAPCTFTSESVAEGHPDKVFDFRPRAIIERLDLLRLIHRQTTNYGHSGKPGLPWEA
jgi:S-adenosylmethionine synthetase